MPTLDRVSPIVVTCHQCHQSTPQADAWIVRLMVPSGIYRNGREVWCITDETAHVCDGCYFQEEEEEKEG